MHQTKTGILLANLGTPDAPTPDAVKRYLRQFLSDKRVVDTPSAVVAASARRDTAPARAAGRETLSVRVDGEGSPLMVYSRRQQQALAARLPIRRLP
jgi:ferrochelatase